MIIIQDFTSKTDLLVGVVRRYNKRTLDWLRKLAKDGTTRELVFRKASDQSLCKVRFVLKDVRLREGERPFEHQNEKFFPAEFKMDFLKHDALDELRDMLQTHTIQVVDKFITVGFELSHRLALTNSLGETYSAPPKIDPFTESPQWDHQSALGALVLAHPIAYLSRGDKRTDGMTDTSVMLQSKEEPHQFTQLVYAEDGWRYESDTSNRDWEKDYERCNIDSAMTLVFQESMSRIYNP